MLAEKNTRIEYLREREVAELFRRLVTALAKHRPEDPVRFLIEVLEKREIPDSIEVPTVKGINL